jgi:hypothetical protein
MGNEMATVNADFANNTPLGKWSGFYRGSQLQGHLLSSDLWITEVPDYLLRTSFPYRKRPYAKEVLFVDTVSFVRFNGGYAKAWMERLGIDDPRELDLAYVDENGELQYRWELVAGRINPYLECGYQNLIISLDNVPYDMAAYESQGSYGQVAPPRDYEEWGRFIEGLCRHPVELYGFDLPNSWTYRMGTENNGAWRGCTHTFDGDHEQWIQWYDYTSAAVKKVLPGAKFGPGEFAGRVVAEGVEEPMVDYVKLFEHCRSGRNYATGKSGAPLEFLANSSHCCPRYVDGKVFGCGDPRDRAEWNRSSYEALRGQFEEYADLPIYTFQFGCLQSEQQYEGKNLQTCEPGGRGAAWTFHTIVEMKETVPNLKGIWHWGVIEPFLPRSAGDVARSLLRSNGWVYSIFDYCQGGDSYVIDAPDSSDGTMYKLLFVTKGDVAYIMAGAFNQDSDNFTPRKLNLTLPKGLLPARIDKGTMGQVWITEKDCVYAEVKKDLAEEGLLKPGYAQNNLLAAVGQMVDREDADRAREFLGANCDKYERMTIDSLTLKPFEGELEESGDDCTVSFEIVPGSVNAIVFNHEAF